MKQLFAALGALALGATAMYYLDPEQGRRRRALVADQVGSVSRDTRSFLEGRSKRTADRVRGLFARMRSGLTGAPPEDEQVHGRIRSRLGRIASYPHAIATEFREGRLVLKGEVPAWEFNAIMAEMWSVRGVQAIDSQLTLHSDIAEVPGMQGKPHRTRSARLRQYSRNGACALAIASGLGAALGAWRNRGSGRAGLLSLAVALLGLGVGDSSRRLVRRRQARQRARGAVERAVQTPAVQRQEERPPQATGEGAAPLAWH